MSQPTSSRDWTAFFAFLTLNPEEHRQLICQKSWPNIPCIHPTRHVATIRPLAAVFPFHRRCGCPRLCRPPSLTTSDCWLAGHCRFKRKPHIYGSHVIGPTTWPSWPESSKNHPIIQFSLALAKFGTASAFCNDCVQVSQGTGPLANNPGGNSVYLCLERFLSTQMYANATLINSIGVSGNETKVQKFKFNSPVSLQNSAIIEMLPWFKRTPHATFWKW